MGRSLLVAFLNCCFLSSSMAFRSGRVGSVALRAGSRIFSKSVLNQIPYSTYAGLNPASARGSSQIFRTQMSTKTETDVVAADAAAEDLFGFDLPTNDNSANLLKVRHTTAHIMAMAVQKLHPEAQVTIGPWIDQG